ncbi:MAG: hypothetical protein H0U56_07100 [Methylibium sp.]|uniref:hypothetical protein n=1 Tax=Methylibium sp. TaxID=2067992 RepID=UPI00181700DD|nr:hypothetical protein [Methylibium sp.]MBA2722656.1 hypothetical protein [Methylibium sp.]MBA3588439.1 hypothetical protein [Methylibium sp.]
MKPHHPDRRPLQCYLLGLALVAVGAGVMEWLDSWLPLALAGSASLMLTVPLVRQIAARKASSGERRRKR